MANATPQASNYLNSPSHSKGHRVYDWDTSANDATLVANADGTVSHSAKLTLRPSLVDQRTKINDNKPTEISRGCNIGYSFPIFNNDNEELFFRMRIPIRWDGTTDPQFGICVTLAGGEDVNDKFKFQLEWQTTNKGNVMGTTTSICTSEQTVLAARNDAYDTYFIFFTLDASDANNPISAGEMLQGRLRRISASSNEVSNEIIVWDWASMWKVGKLYGAWSVETNDA
jgi:hypothetical protein